MVPITEPELEFLNFYYPKPEPKEPKSFFNAEIDLVSFGEDDEEDKENDDIDFF
jgi:hypothetical protein